MKDFAPIYRDFVNYKLRSPRTYINACKKIRSLEDAKYALGLASFAIKHLLFQKRINNETVRGRK